MIEVFFIAVLGATVLVCSIVDLFAALARGTDSTRKCSALLLLGVMLSLPAWKQDSGDSTSERVELYAPVAKAIVNVTDDHREQVFLVIQAWFESAFARYVLEDRCHHGPPGGRCDDGTATGPWQVHRWCNEAWDATISHLERLEGGARCALSLARSGRRRCRGAMSGAFAAQWRFDKSRGGAWCAQPWAMRRAARLERVIGGGQ